MIPAWFGMKDNLLMWPHPHYWSLPTSAHIPSVLPVKTHARALLLLVEGSSFSVSCLGTQDSVSRGHNLHFVRGPKNDHMQAELVLNLKRCHFSSGIFIRPLAYSVNFYTSEAHLSKILTAKGQLENKYLQIWSLKFKGTTRNSLMWMNLCCRHLLMQPILSVLALQLGFALYFMI